MDEAPRDARAIRLDARPEGLEHFFGWVTTSLALAEAAAGATSLTAPAHPSTT